MNRRSLIAGLAALPVAGAAALLAREGDAGVKPHGIPIYDPRTDLWSGHLTGESGPELVMNNGQMRGVDPNGYYIQTHGLAHFPNFKGPAVYISPFTA